MTRFIGTRADSLAAMQAFVSGMGQRYEKGRNDDNGPRHHTDVSMLSPSIRRPLITEREVVAAGPVARLGHGDLAPCHSRFF